MIFIILALLVMGISCSANGQACWNFDADLRSSEVVPPPDSQARGWFLSNFRPSCTECVQHDDLLKGWTDQLRDFQGVPDTVRIHHGAQGENGPVLYQFPIGVQNIQFDPDHCTELHLVELYVVVTTDIYPEGEARGQIIPYPPTPTVKETWGRIRSQFR